MIISGEEEAADEVNNDDEVERDSPTEMEDDKYDEEDAYDEEEDPSDTGLDAEGSADSLQLYSFTVRLIT